MLLYSVFSLHLPPLILCVIRFLHTISLPSTSSVLCMWPVQSTLLLWYSNIGNGSQRHFWCKKNRKKPWASWVYAEVFVHVYGFCWTSVGVVSSILKSYNFFCPFILWHKNREQGLNALSLSWLSSGTQMNKQVDPQFWRSTTWWTSVFMMMFCILSFASSTTAAHFPVGFIESHTCYFTAKTLLPSSSSQPTERFHKGHASTCDINVCVNTCLYAYSWHFHIWQMFQQAEFLSYECFKANK